MPAYVGGKFDVAGIKWISSFPKNIEKNIPRAHSIIVLNNAETGIPISVINTPLMSIIRTASVSGFFLSSLLKKKGPKNLSIGIIGWGPIGQFHYRMCLSLFRERIKSITIFDIRTINLDTIPKQYRNITNIVNCWEQAYINKDIVITATVSDKRYIDKKPRKGSILINVSLRDYKENVFKYVKNGIVIDNWEEVCREDTDIERFCLKEGLKKDKTFSLEELIDKKTLAKIKNLENIMFNPMGMAVFDIAVAKHYVDKATSYGKGVELK
jgi:ornithine cyclodeaminase